MPRTKNAGPSFSAQDRQWWWQRRIHPALHSLHYLQTFAETQSGTQVYLLSGAGVLHFIHSFYWASCTLWWQHMKGNSVICQMYSVTWFPRYWWEAIWNITREYKVFPADCRINRSGGSGSMKYGFMRWWGMFVPLLCDRVDRCVAGLVIFLHLH